MRQRRAGVEHEMTAEVVGGQVHVTVDAHGADDSFVNGLTSTLSIIDPRRRDDSTEVPLRQTAPGWYEALPHRPGRHLPAPRGAPKRGRPSPTASDI